MRTLIAPLRILLLLLHALVGLAIAALIFPWIALTRRNRIIKTWSRLLLTFCGARLRPGGVEPGAGLAATGIEAGSQGRLLLANHISWIDIFALNAALPSRFVAKSEIGKWPLLGALVTRVGTLYIERGRRHAVATMNHRVRDCLRAGESVAVFAEGTTSDGDTLLPFHSNLVAPALEAQAPVWPVALRYTEGGAFTRAAAFVGEMGFVTSLWNICASRTLLIELTFCEPLAPEAFATRHQIADVARQSIAAALGLAVEPHPRFNRPVISAPAARTQPARSAGSATEAP